MDRNEPVIHSNLQEQGFGVLEGMIAAAVVAIGFVGILHVATVATQTLLYASSQDKLTMLTTMMLEEIAQDANNLAKYNNVNLLSSPPSHARGQKKSARWLKRFQSYCGSQGPLNQCLRNATISIETKCKNSNSQLVNCGNPPNSQFQQIRILTVDVKTTKGPRNLDAEVTRTFNIQ
jgi:Tfp pilus assembly protein PilV